jgi:hypothetical protein
VLEAAGLKVAEVDGWKERGNGDMKKVEGIICHHTAGPRTGNMPSLAIVRDGRPDLPGPLSQLGLGRDGTFYVIAAGKCHHAGKGVWEGIATGNSNFIGIEAENTGLANDFPWPDVQMDAYRRGVAAILKHIAKSAKACCAHREYAHPKGRKSDPTFDMEDFRARVAAILDGTATVRPPIPPVEPAPPPGRTPRKTLRRGDQDDLVIVIQRKLRVEPTSKSFGPKTEAAVRGFQRKLGMVGDGIVGPKTWVELDKLPDAKP